MKAPVIVLLLSSIALALPVHAQLSPSKQPTTKTAATNPTPSSKIDLNKADLTQLTGSFKGIGKKRAQAIIDYRQTHNGFKSLEELADVKGLGQHFLSLNKDKLNEVYVIR